jgi:hypothetical protein
VIKGKVTEAHWIPPGYRTRHRHVIRWVVKIIKSYALNRRLESRSTRDSLSFVLSMHREPGGYLILPVNSPVQGL